MRTQKRRIKFLDRSEISKIITSIDDDFANPRDARDRALLEVLWSTGLRIHEALALQAKDFVGLPAGTHELTVVGKGGWQRVVFFSGGAVRAIKRWLELKADDAPELFPMTIRTAQLMVKRRAERAGIETRVTPHMFRHSLATDLLKRGIDVRVVQEFLGHRSISSTQVYTHVTNKDLKDIHTKLYK